MSTDLFVADKAIGNVVLEREKLAMRDAEWKKAAEVVNNFALILHVVVVIITFGVVFFKAFFN